MTEPATTQAEKAVFTDARPRDLRSRWALLLLALLLLATVYGFVRDVIHTRVIYGFAQRAFNTLASPSVEKIGSVEIDIQGDVILRQAEVFIHRKGQRQLFMRAEALRLTFDGIPLRDEDLHVMRMDLHRPEIYIRREYGGDWNVFWAFQRAPGHERRSPPPPPRGDPWEGYVRPDESFPRNGVHIHDGTIHMTFLSRTGREVTWSITGVRGSLRKIDGTVVMNPLRGDFYGGRIKAYCEVPDAPSFTVRQLTATVDAANVARMAEGAYFIKRPVSGRLDAVLALAFDRTLGFDRPIVSGRCTVTEGNLWEFPPLWGILNLFSLTDATRRRIDSGVLEFTVEEDKIRVDKMHFLGYPVSLFGSGATSLTGDWIDITFHPRLGKDSWNDILPVIGAPIDLLSNLLKRAFLTVHLTGPWENPRFGVSEEEPADPALRALIEEKGPR